jgi:hypothetical protein
LGRHIDKSDFNGNLGIADSQQEEGRARAVIQAMPAHACQISVHRLNSAAVGLDQQIGRGVVGRDLFLLAGSRVG